MNCEVFLEGLHGWSCSTLILCACLYEILDSVKDIYVF